MRHPVRSILSVAVLSAGLAAGPALAEGPLVVSSWGGAFTKATLDNFVAPFAAEKGIEYQMVDASGQHMAQVQAQNSAGKITWDVIDSLDLQTAEVMFDRDLLEPLPADLKARLEATSLPGMVTDYGIMLSSIATPIICNKELVKACPSNAAEFFDIENFPGDRAAYTDPFGTLTMALHVLGVDDRAPTPEETDQAFALIEKIQPSLRTLWGSGEESMQLMRSGEAQIALIWNRPARTLSQESPDKYVVAWDGVNYVPAYIVVVKGAPHKELAFQYLEFYATHPENQAAWSSTTSYGIAHPDALDLVTPEAKAWLPETHLEGLVGGNVQWWTENRDELVKRWRQTIGG